MILGALMLAAALPAWVVIEPVANLYSQPADDAEVVSQTLYATEVVILDSTDRWSHVRTTDDYTGWMRTSGIHRREEGSYAVAGKVARVESLFANLYREPDVTRHPPLLTVPYNVRLEVASEPEADSSRWLEILLPDGRTAWAQRGDMSFSEATLDVEEVIALARRFVGLPYLWGGTSSFGFDCSGFTQLLYRRRGIGIPRDSGPQSRWEGARSVDRAELQPGDLLFFGEAPDEISHTGMYIGDGEFIHATAHGTPAVQISRIDEPYWDELLVGARRPK